MIEQQQITGTPAADGMVVGKAFVIAAKRDRVNENPAGSGARYTLNDFNLSIEETKKQLLQFQQRLQERITEPVTQIFAAHLMILEDDGFMDKIKKLIGEGTPVQDSINQVTDEYIRVFSQKTDSLVREKADDLEDLARRILKNLEIKVSAGGGTDYQGWIVITPKLFPSDLLRLVAEKAEGLILTSGGVSSHITVLARCLEIPMILIDSSLLKDVKTGTPLLMDANSGILFANPDKSVISTYETRLKSRGNTLPDTENSEPQTQTRDGRRIRLLGAIGLISEARLAHALGAEGIGLYRSEMPFLVRNDFPSEEDQYGVYRKVMKEMEESEIVFRTLDIGGDKILSYFQGETESNPFLGLRGLRFSFRFREIFNAQVRAMLRAGHDRPLKIMFPLVSSVDNFIYARDLVRALIRDLKAENIPHQSNPDIGAMIELPCAVSLAGELASEADFLSIGSNDLVQYMLAVDRTNKDVAAWYVPWHPAILRAIKRVIDAAHLHDKPVSICGDMADDLKLIPLLIGMGITSLTIPPRRIVSVHRLIQSLDAGSAEKLSRKVLAASTLAEIARILGIPWEFSGI